ncbi:hypothetical protein CC78DRAFT_583975 [Lojkania enalia]|uniref:Uncharacterized protein n=1 Tax=Lojkania enalia TaxID=147567 RepID=A0A9P4K3B3_9PLEO|nr:hypothetical protein CC78DRAFT_583975 [Didymosphaeria enalia]
MSCARASLTRPPPQSHSHLPLPLPSPPLPCLLVSALSSPGRAHCSRAAWDAHMLPSQNSIPRSSGQLLALDPGLCLGSCTSAGAKKQAAATPGDWSYAAPSHPASYISSLAFAPQPSSAKPSNHRGAAPRQCASTLLPLCFHLTSHIDPTRPPPGHSQGLLPSPASLHYAEDFALQPACKPYAQIGPLYSTFAPTLPEIHSSGRTRALGLREASSQHSCCHYWLPVYKAPVARLVVAVLSPADDRREQTPMALLSFSDPFSLAKGSIIMCDPSVSVIKGPLTLASADPKEADRM